jgi:hydrogenase nickel incorporation protein HypA/HybF
MTVRIDEHTGILYQDCATGFVTMLLAHTKVTNMHELSATRMMLSAALTAARSRGIGRIRKISLVVGELTGFVDEPVTTYFRDLSRGTPADGAVLTIRHVPMVLECRGCGKTQPVGVPLPSVCPACGSADIRASGGMQWYIASVEGEPDEKSYG